MKNQTEVLPPKSPYQLLAEKIAEGTALGSGAVTVLTPFLYVTARVADKQKVVWRQAMSSAPQLVAAVAPVTAVAYTMNAVLTRAIAGEEKVSDSQKVMISTVAGGIAGVVNTPFDLFAQDKQLRKEAVGMKDTYQRVVQANGRMAMMSGCAAVVAREATWAASYMTMVKLVSQELQSRAYSSSQSEFMAAVTVGGALGIVSTPLYTLRYEKQKGLTEKKPKESYVSIAKRQGIKGLFSPVVPRTVTMVAASAIFSKGAEWMETYSPFSRKQ